MNTGMERYASLGRKLRALYRAEALETSEAPDWWKAALVGVQMTPMSRPPVPIRLYVAALAAVLVLTLVSIAALLMVVPQQVMHQEGQSFSYAPLALPSTGIAVPIVPFAFSAMLALSALGCQTMRRLRYAGPWVGLIMVGAGTLAAYLVFAGVADYNGLIPELVWLMTTAYGFIGLTIVVTAAWFSPVPIVPAGAVAVGIISMVSFALAPWGWNVSMAPMLLPGLGLFVFGIVLWRRQGLFLS